MFETSAETDKLDEAIAKMQGDLEPVIKDNENPFFKSKYADLASVINASRKALKSNGLSVTQWPVHSTDGRLTLVTRIAHAGQWMKATFSLPVTKQDPQGYSSALTYGRRISLMAALSLGAEDDDGEKAIDRHQSPYSVQPVKTQPKPLPNYAPVANPGEYVVVGGTFAGMKIKDIDPEELNIQIEKTIDMYTKKGKSLSVEARRFIEHADEFLNKEFPETYQSQVTKPFSKGQDAT